MYSLYQDFGNTTFFVGYFGIFTDQITNMLIDLNECCVSKTEQHSKIAKKTSFLIAESFQNIIRHGTVKQGVEDMDYSRDYFEVAIFSDRMGISTANVIENQYIEDLSTKIDYINSLDSETLREYKIAVLEHGMFSDKGGAGLGLIEMVRKSGAPMKKTFIPLTSEYSMIVLCLEVPIGKTTNTDVLNIDEVVNRYKCLVEKEILLIYKGDFSDESNTQLIEMMHNNFMKGSELDAYKIKSMMLIIEVLQNVTKHAKIIDNRKDGLLILSILNGELFVECSNFVEKNQFADFRNYMKKLKSSTPTEIQKQYHEKLTIAQQLPEVNYGLGLLEIARVSKNTYSYSFTETANNEIFYTIKLKA